MSYKYQKEYSLSSVIVKVPKDCGTGIGFWINQQVASVIDNIPVRLDENSYSSRTKLSDCINGSLHTETGDAWEVKECGHGEWVQKETGYLVIRYDFSDHFILTDLDCLQDPGYQRDHVKGKEHVEGYVKLIGDALAASGIETEVIVRTVKHYYTPSCNEEFCSYCATDRRHKAQTRTVKKKRVGPRFYEWTAYQKINVPAPAEMANAA